jgi:hypothetical protein
MGAWRTARNSVGRGCSLAGQLTSCHLNPRRLPFLFPARTAVLAARPRLLPNPEALGWT